MFVNTLQIYGILLVTIGPVVFAKNLNFEALLADSGEYVDDSIESLFNSVEQAKEQNKKYTVCETEACKILASQILKGMNKSVNPCDDFYGYTCGGWNSQNLIPPYEASWGNVKIFQNTVHCRIRGVLETAPKRTDILPVRQAKKWYRSCMNVEDREKRGIKPVESILMQTGGWPMIMDSEEWDEDDYSWQRVEDQYFSITGSFIFYSISPAWGHSDTLFTTEVHISKGKLPLTTEDRESKNFTGVHYTAYVHLIEDIVKEFVEHNKANVSDEMIRKDVEDLIKFEEKLQKLLEEDSDREEMTVVEFINAYNENITDLASKNKIDFESKIKMFFNMGNINIEDSTPIAVSYLPYYVKVTKLLSETPTRTIANYLHWKFVSQILRFTTHKMETVFFKFSQVEDGVVEKPPRWLQCIKDLKMEDVQSYVFVEKYFHESIKTDASKMIENIREEMELQIDRSNWLDDDSKQLLKEKLNNMKFFVGFPDWYKNRTAVISSYRGLKIGYDYFENILSHLRYESKMAIHTLKLRERDGPWSGMSATEVEAVYGGSEITVGAPVFQSPLFTAQVPQSVNYGMTGTIIGHEIGHGFDNNDIKYGLGFNETELTKQVIEMYNKRAECFLDQFNEYWGVTEPTAGEKPPKYADWTPGRRTRAENIADTTGLPAVFEAYRKIQKNNSDGDFKLPGFEEYTDEEMFFLAYGTVWCHIDRPEYAEKSKRENSHSPGRLRVMGALSNTDSFAKVFNCPKGSPMNPEDKCNIWRDSEEKKEQPLPISHDGQGHSRGSIILN